MKISEVVTFSITGKPENVIKARNRLQNEVGVKVNRLPQPTSLPLPPPFHLQDFALVVGADSVVEDRKVGCACVGITLHHRQKGSEFADYSR